ncbi:hypothetical protein TRFO_20479 [Tritrichomonas foetus]|uniref:Bromo domain-containing protein n=1 Tax=Tritrichomonas foetus TaxID=1144522 RepID=A0A1J4KGJ3_9EUKA|nr:hypothetical protein TRFO_20479 [Tritrichomonas foetus]|eukprot:OHT10339.1 hypothetical protein TRFO_20479 [Tritrichomonas foetus]
MKLSQSEQQPFTSASYAHAVRIMESLAQCPCAKPFLLPVDPLRDHLLHYYQIITTPIDISLIIDRLLIQKYQTVESWIQDVYLIRDNARAYNGETSFVYQLSLCLMKQFEKRLEEFYVHGGHQWTRTYLSITKKLQKQIKQLPPSLSSLATTITPLASLQNMSPKPANGHGSQNHAFSSYSDSPQTSNFINSPATETKPPRSSKKERRQIDPAQSDSRTPPAQTVQADPPENFLATNYVKKKSQHRQSSVQIYSPNQPLYFPQFPQIQPQPPQQSQISPSSISTSQMVRNEVSSSKLKEPIFPASLTIPPGLPESLPPTLPPAINSSKSALIHQQSKQAQNHGFSRRQSQQFHSISQQSPQPPPVQQQGLQQMQVQRTESSHQGFAIPQRESSLFGGIELSDLPLTLPPATNTNNSNNTNTNTNTNNSFNSSSMGYDHMQMMGMSNQMNMQQTQQHQSSMFGQMPNQIPNYMPGQIQQSSQNQDGRFKVNIFGSSNPLGDFLLGQTISPPEVGQANPQIKKQ